MSQLDRETTSNLTKIADDAQQHLETLSSLGVSVSPEMAINIIESKLPKSTLDKWESSFDKDKPATLDFMHEFLYKRAVCVSKRDRNQMPESDRDKGEPLAKKRRQHVPHNTFMSNTMRNCIACNAKRHPLYACDKFQRLSVSKRFEIVKRARLCYTCLKSHIGIPCKALPCSVCKKRHNTLLHFEQSTLNQKTENLKPETDKTD
ncbi:uncharacterized protein [Cardiocondyla obscurior]|uniref:uncharacterized protein n=1 Tax=Cardiocondyla obscurior TaxID=286306 RepID=UPI0039655FFD